MIKIQVQKLYVKPNSLQSITSKLLNTIAGGMKEKMEERYKGLKCEKCSDNSLVTIKPDAKGEKYFSFKTNFCCSEFEDFIAKNYAISFKLTGK